MPPIHNEAKMSYNTKFNILLTHPITFYISISALMIIGHFLPGEVAENQTSWAVWATFGVVMAHIVFLVIFVCVMYVKDKKLRKQYE